MSFETKEKSWLSDSWVASGKTLEGFKTEIERVTKQTSFMLVKPDEMEFCYRLEADAGDYHKVMVLSPARLLALEMQLAGYRSSKPETFPSLPVGTTPKSYFAQDLAEESFKGVGFLIAWGKAPLYVSEGAKATLCMRAGVAGEQTGKNSLYLTQAIVEALGRGKEVTVVVREDDEGNKKAFAFMSKKYEPIPQTVLPTAIEELMKENVLGQAKVKGWAIDHQFTAISLEYPEAAAEFSETYKLKDGVVPGLTLMNSDTGASSLIIRGTYRMPNRRYPVIVDEFSHKHAGAITPEDVLRAANEEILAKLRLLPEALAEKMTAIIGDGLTATVKDRSRNVKAVQAAYKHVIAKTGIKKELGASRTKQLYELLCQEIDPACVYTQYDVCTTIMGLADRVDGLSREMQNRLGKACGKAAFVQIGTTKQADMDDLVLLPEVV